MAEAAFLFNKRKERWVIISFFFLSGILTATWSSRIPDIQHKLGLSNAALGGVLFAIPVGLVTGLTIAGWLVATFGPQRIMLVSCIFCAVTLVIVAMASTVFSLMFFLFLLGLGRTVFGLSANTSAIDLQRHYQHPILARFHGVWSLACLVAAGAGTVMIIWDVKLLLHFLIMAMAALVVAIALVGKNSGQLVSKERQPLFVKPDKHLFLLGLITLSAMLCEGAVFDWSVNYFDKVVHAKKSFVTIGYMAFVISMTAGRLAGDRLIRMFGVFRMLVANGLLMAGGFAIAALFPFIFPAGFGFLLIGLGDSILVPMVYMLAAKSKKMPAAYALSSVTLIGYCGFLIGPLFIGNVADIWGMSVAFLCLSGISMLIILIALQVRNPPEN
ncbi:MAG: MFS transporter [Chitinophagaceae bacterium]